jgi:thermitase
MSIRIIQPWVLACFMLILLAVECAFTPPTFAKPVTIGGKTYDIVEPGDSVPGELVVQLKDGFSPAAAAAVASRLGGRIAGHVPEYNLFLIKIGVGTKEAVLNAVRAAKQDPAVKDAFPNTKFSIPKPGAVPPSSKKSPNPPDVGAGVSDENFAGDAGVVALAAPTGGQWHLNMINWYDAGTPPTATGIVAVVDTGVDYTHPDLVGKVILGKDYVEDDSDPMDVAGHGTHVAGIIAARGAYMAWGVSPNTKILAVRVLDSSGSGSWFDIVQGIIYARNYAGVKAINLSLGGYAYEGTGDYNTLKQVIDDTVNVRKVLPVVAAGNEDNYYLYRYQSSKLRPIPAWYPNSFTVGATQEADMRAYFSNYDVGTLDGKTFNYVFVDIVAPGWDILSTYPGSQIVRMSGTSMATPVVAGCVARTWAKYPTYTPAQVVARLQATGRSVNVYNGFPSAERRVDLMKALGINATGFVGVVYNGQSGVTLPGVTVTAKAGATTIATTTTNSEGFFRLKGLTGGTAYAISYAKTGFSAPVAGAVAAANQLVPLAKPVFMNQNRPTGQWSVLIDWRSWHPGYDEAVVSYPSKPAWYPYNWDTTAGMFFSPYVKSTSLGTIDLDNWGSLTASPYMALTHSPYAYTRPGHNFVIKPQSGQTYKVYTLLDNIHSDYYEWGKYKTTTNVTQPLVQARVYLGPTLKYTANAQAATGTGPYWHIATISGSTVTPVNKLQTTAP